MSRRRVGTKSGQLYLIDFMLFSQRQGFKPPAKAIQIESVDEELRNGLWSVFCLLLWDKSTAFGPLGRRYINDEFRTLFDEIWICYFKKPVDSRSSDVTKVREKLKAHFFECQWHEVFDLTEFLVKNVKGSKSDELRDAVNQVLERECSGYRFVGSIIVPITRKDEIETIDQALSTGIAVVTIHFERALNLLADRKQPDYRNSIKESISAVESLCKIITGEKKATLASALKVLAPKVGIHKALEHGFLAIYGYTSDEGGIRHAMMEESNLSFSDAKFMLVACSAFVTFVLGKASEVGLVFN